jgi:pimeloyl-ACP methyl ester carboxylesterase
MNDYALIETTSRSQTPRASRGWAGAAVTAGTVASVLTAAAVFANARARQAERRHPPRGRFLDIDDVRVHYLERGTGSPVVLLHGNGSMIEDWEISGVLDGLAATGHRVIAFDRPGFGYSARPRRRIWTPAAQAELVYVALKELGVERPTVVGHSWGTLVALALALSHPDEVMGLVLLSGYYFPTTRADVPLMSPPAIPVLGDVLRYTASPLLARALAPKLIRKVFAPAPVTRRFKAEFPMELAMRPSQIRASAAETALMIPAARQLGGRYHELRMPVGIMAGAEDQIVSVRRHSERLREELPGSELRLVPGAGHMVHHTAPEAVLELIAHLESRTSPAGRLVRGMTPRSVPA